MTVVRQAHSSKLLDRVKVVQVIMPMETVTLTLLYKGTSSQVSNSLANEMFRTVPKRISLALP